MARISLVALCGILTVASAKQCQNMTIPVNIMARNGVFNVPNITSDPDVTQFIQNFSSIMGGSNYTNKVTLGFQTVTGLYNISAKFCRPDNMTGSEPAVQVLTHGIGFDKTYWDLPYNNYNYSYENIATSMGYCTLAIDRLGIGNSSKGDPYSVIQAPAEVSALYQINSMLRNGSLPGVNYTFGTGKIVNVGHSFGSQQSFTLASMYPSITDALILTGFSVNGSFLNLGSFDAKIAALNQPLRFGSPNATSFLTGLLTSNSTSVATSLKKMITSDNLTSQVTDILRTTSLGDLIAGYNMTPPMVPQNLPYGYITWADAGANQYNFLYPAGMDPALLTYAESTKQPFTIGEALTLGPKPGMSPFTGPVQVITGREDAIYCGGDCLNTGLPNVTSIPEGVGMYLPNASNFSVNIPEDAGHALTVHYTAPAAYMEAQTYLMSQGIMSS